MGQSDQDQGVRSVPSSQSTAFEDEARSLLNQFLRQSSNAKVNGLQARAAPETARGSPNPGHRLSINTTTHQPTTKIKRSPRTVSSASSKHVASRQSQFAVVSESDLRQKQDSLRAKLLELGVWFEDVDELIKFCEVDASELGDFRDDPHMILSSPRAPALTLGMASDLYPGIGIVSGWSKPHKTNGNRSHSQRQTIHEPSREETSNVQRQLIDVSSSDLQPAPMAAHSHSDNLHPEYRPRRGPGRPRSTNTTNRHFPNPTMVLDLGQHRVPQKKGPKSSQVSSRVFAQEKEISNNIKCLPRYSSSSSSSPNPTQSIIGSRNGFRKRTESPNRPSRFVASRSSSQNTVRYSFMQGVISKAEPSINTKYSRPADPKGGLDLALRSGEKACWQLKTKCAKRRIFDHVQSNLRKWKTWTGASHDVINVGWSPDGTRYVAGSAGLEDRHTMQYNRPNNLLVGSLVTNSMKSLSDHRRQRPCPESVGSGPNSLAETYRTSDEWLYTTITSLGWSRGSDRLFTASYDETVKVWDTSTTASELKCISTFKHEAKVEAMTVSKHPKSLLASCANQGERSLRLYTFNEDYSNGWYTSVSLADETERQTFSYAPGPLQFGISNASVDYLVAGFASGEKEDLAPSPHGYLALYRIAEGRTVKEKVQPHKQNVFDVVWSPNSTYFATGNAAPLLERKKGKVNSQVRIYDIQELPGRLIEYDCPALDINEVTFCDFDGNYVTASCTDGSTYVWDFRRPDQILHRLTHGEPMSELLHDRPRELSDVGVRAAQWGNHTHEFYTGASDGILKLWDIRRSPEDVFIKDVASFNAEIMSAKFSADKSNMIIGDGQGSIHLLSTAPLDGADEVGELFLEENSNLPKVIETVRDNDILEPWTEGRTAAKELLLTKQIILDPRYGAGKGPNYCGPYARWARPHAIQEQEVSTSSLLPEIQALQLDQTRWAAKRPKRPSMVLPQGAIVIDLENSDDEALKYDQELAKKRRTDHAFNGRRLPIKVIDLTDGEVEVPIKEESQFESLSESGDDETEDWSEDYWFPPHCSYSANLLEESL